MKIREKSDPERVMTDVFPTQLGNFSGWGKENAGQGSFQFYPATTWEPVPPERWVSQDVYVLNDGRTIRFVQQHTRIVDLQLPDGIRAIQYSARSVEFEQRVSE